MNCSPPGSSVHEIFQDRILEWVAISFSTGSSQPRDWNWVSCTAGRFFTDWATREALVEADAFLELFCLFDDPTDVGNLISGSSAVSKSSLNIWKFTVHVLLEPGLKNFEHYFTSLWDECNCAVVNEHALALPLKKVLSWAPSLACMYTYLHINIYVGFPQWLSQ